MPTAPNQTDGPRPSPILSLRGSVKSFGAVAALANGTIEILPGEIHALVGENGAGKSMLVKVLAGLYTPDAGDFRVGGQQVAFRGVADNKSAP
jgi:rhamnose transport system ATP-binding protein